MEVCGKANGTTHTFSADCRAHFLLDRTWGRLKAPLADKQGVKSLIREAMQRDKDLKNKNVKLVPTLLYLNIGNITDLTLQDLQRLPKPVIVKPRHTSDGVSRTVV